MTAAQAMILLEASENPNTWGVGWGARCVLNPEMKAEEARGQIKLVVEQHLPTDVLPEPFAFRILQVCQNRLRPARIEFVGPAKWISRGEPAEEPFGFKYVESPGMIATIQPAPKTTICQSDLVDLVNKVAVASARPSAVRPMTSAEIAMQYKAVQDFMERFGQRERERHAQTVVALAQSAAPPPPAPRAEPPQRQPPPTDLSKPGFVIRRPGPNFKRK